MASSSPMSKTSTLLLLISQMAIVSISRGAPSINPADLSQWKKTGQVTIDSAKKHANTSSTGALKLEPGSHALLPLRSENGSGTVSFWVFDDGVAQPDLGARHAGPRWGLVAADGNVIVGVELYAKFLGNDPVIAITSGDQKDWFRSLQWVGIKRVQGWHQWEFEADPNAGLVISVDSKPVKRFDWNKTTFAGFSGIILIGDDMDTKAASILWVDNIQYTLSGPMEISTVAPTPKPTPKMPQTDPAPEGPVPQLKASIQGKHPRLFVTAETLPKLKEFYMSAAGAPWRQKIEGYLGSCNPPTNTKYLNDATEAQRQGLWRLPTVALHYLLTGDPDSLKKAIGFLEQFEAQPIWEIGEKTGGEVDSGMGAANIMIGAALAYDWLYNDLEPAFRDKFQQTLIYHARAMYYRGHLNLNNATAYWQQDPQNNHRWHRNAGLMLSILAAYDGQPEAQWILEKGVRDLEFVNKWLPEDGTCHEGSLYLTFGGNHLLLAMKAADDCLGTKFLDGSYYRHVGLFRIHLLLGSMDKAISFGDADPGGLGGYNNFFQLASSVSRQADIKDGLMRMFEKHPDSLQSGWFSLLWDDPSVPRGDVSKLPKAVFWPDIGTATLHSSWNDDAVVSMFRCGPFGGYTLNIYAQTTASKYVNVAHDDPDANAFTFGIGGEMLAVTDGYAHSKASRSHNTILINGLGQMTLGRKEGEVWSQPGGDMTKMAVVTAWRNTGDIVAVEGEAAGSYLAYTDKKEGKSRPALDRFRRTYLWVNGDYILALDDVRAPQEVEVSWLMQGPKLEAMSQSDGRFSLISATKSCPFQVVSDHPLTYRIQDSPAENKGTPLGYKQLCATAKVSAIRIASIYNPWQKKNLSVKIDPLSGEEANVTVEGEGFNDVWNWKAATGQFAPSTLKATRVGGSQNPSFPFMMDTSNSKPPQ